MARIDMTSTLKPLASRRPMPEALRLQREGKGCRLCRFGIIHAPEVTTSLPLYLRDAVLDDLGAIVWCECELGQVRKTAAERTMIDVRSTDTAHGVRGEYIAGFVLAAIEAQLTPSVHFEGASPAPDPDEKEDWWTN